MCCSNRKKLLTSLLMTQSILMKTSLNNFMAATLLATLMAGCSIVETDDEFKLDDSFFENATVMETSTVAESLVTIDQSQFASYKFSKKSNEVINDSKSFERLWKDIHANRTPLPELPEVDFTEYTVIAAMMGIQSSGGYTIEILEIAEADNVVGVKIKEHEPGSDCVTTAALTSPFHIVKIHKRVGSVFRFTTDRTVFQCDSE